MRLTLVLLALTSLLLVPATSGAPYLQHQVDAGRTGASTDPGPSHLDVAFTLELPEARAPWSPPLILDRGVYVLVAPQDPAAINAGAGNLTGLVRVDVDTAEVTTLAEFDARPSSMAGDGERWYVTTETGVVALPVGGGDAVWAWTYEPPAGAAAPALTCVPPALYGEHLYIGCTEGHRDAETEGLPFPSVIPDAEGGTGPSVLVAALERETGHLAWAWRPSDEVGQQTAQQPFTPDPIAPAWTAGATVHGVTLTANHVLVSVMSGVRGATSATGSTAERGPLVVALARPDGAWVTDFYGGSVGDSDLAYQDQRSSNQPPMAVAGDESNVFIQSYVLRAYDADDLEERWDRGLEDRDVTRGQSPVLAFTGTALALPGSQVVATSGSHVHRLEAHDGQTAWVSDSIPGDWEGVYGLLVAGGRAYAAGYGSVLHVFDAETGQRLHDQATGARGAWSLEPRLMYGLGDGVLALVTLDGRLTVLGRTSLSILPEVEVSERYPAPGEPVRVDMGATRPGALAPDLEYQVTWGDGGREAWSTAPVFEHGYAQPNTYEAILSMRNSAGQTANETITFHVGGTPPSEPTLLETAFARENQDLTFGILGIALALGGGFIAVGRRRTRRGRLQRELEAIDQAAQAAGDNPARLRAAMEERRAHCHGLLLDGRLDEAQFAVLERHIEAIERGQRMDQMRELFDVLPHAMVLALEEMLADGRITAWERTSFHTLLDENEVLTTDQKETVRDLVDDWFQRDTGVQA